MFGWNALAIMLKDTNNFNSGCGNGSKGTHRETELLPFPACRQESQLVAAGSALLQGARSSKCSTSTMQPLLT